MFSWRLYIVRSRFQILYYVWKRGKCRQSNLSAKELMKCSLFCNIFTFKCVFAELLGALKATFCSLLHDGTNATFTRSVLEVSAHKHDQSHVRFLTENADPPVYTSDWLSNASWIPPIRRERHKSECLHDTWKILVSYSSTWLSYEEERVVNENIWLFWRMGKRGRK